MESISGIVDQIVLYIPIAVSVVGSFALIASVTPNKADDKIAQLLLDVINFLGANIGKATNKPEDK
jgi:hypothetical protein